MLDWLDQSPNNVTFRELAQDGDQEANRIADPHLTQFPQSLHSMWVLASQGTWPFPESVPGGVGGGVASFEDHFPFRASSSQQQGNLSLSGDSSSPSTQPQRGKTRKQLNPLGT